jgi:hypothetical protein
MPGGLPSDALRHALAAEEFGRSAGLPEWCGVRDYSNEGPGSARVAGPSDSVDDHRCGFAVGRHFDRQCDQAEPGSFYVAFAAIVEVALLALTTRYAWQWPATEARDSEAFQRSDLQTLIGSRWHQMYWKRFTISVHFDPDRGSPGVAADLIACCDSGGTAS